MSEEFIEASKFREIILDETPIIDVRAPVEFTLGHIPGSVNLALLNDEERAQVGTIYKQQGQEAAIVRGHQLVSGSTRDSRIAQWYEFTKNNPRAVITCFRGGLRSKTSQAWLAEAGFQRPRLKGGYKAFRQFLLYELEKLSTQSLLAISGCTGSGKTLLLQELKSVKKTLNLEALARHRGSAFGAYLTPQPSQANFENHLTAELIKVDSNQTHGPLLMEDESRMIGKCAQPETLFKNLRESKVILIEEPLESRVQTIFNEYVLLIPQDKRQQIFLNYQNSLKAISQKLGGLRFQELTADLSKAMPGDLELHKIWIEKLLVWYYDPLYFKSLDKRSPKILFRGTRNEAAQYLLKS